MSLTNLEILQNSKTNFENFERFVPSVKGNPLGRRFYKIAREQLDNALRELVENKKGLNDMFPDEDVD